nr:MAG TPA: head to tail adaptor [Caudoviricetes sp.]
MADLTTRLAAYVGDVPADEYLRSCVAEATTLVGSQVGNITIPQEVHDRAVMEVAAELYHRRSAPNGIKSFADGLDGATAIRVARDALVAARPLLTPYLPLAIS